MDNRRSTPVLNRPGSALLLVLVVTVLLSVIGILFVMVTRLRDITSSNVADSRDLESGVEAVVEQINKALVNDMNDVFVKNLPPFDATGSDPWLASLEPDATNWKWPVITNLFNKPVVWDQNVVIIPDYQVALDVNDGFAADADGDGVADSIWSELPNLSTSRGQPVFAAVRVIDNCAMLNLNTAFGFYPNPVDTNPWHSSFWFRYVSPDKSSSVSYETAEYGKNLGRYLSEVNYTPFLRAYDIRPSAHVERLRVARDPLYSAVTPSDYHEQVILNIESPGPDYVLFDISDELEIRNRYLITSKTISYFERRHLGDDKAQREAFPPNPYVGTLYYTFDFGRGTFEYDDAGYGKSRVPSTPFTNVDFDKWQNKLNPLFFDYNPDSATLPDYQYDRRHICTFYSFDRNIRTAQTDFYTFVESQSDAIRDIFVPKYKAAITTNIQTPADAQPYNNLETRRKILHLLYAFREYFENTEGLTRNHAAIKSSQIVANMMDYTDNDTDLTDGPLGNAQYGSQVNAYPTYIKKDIIDKMIVEVSGNNPAVVGNVAYDFGLYTTDIVYGYERQPFISKIYISWDGSQVTALLGFAVELINPYDKDIKLKDWRLIAGSINHQFTESDLVVPAHGRLVIHSGSSISVDPNAKSYNLNFSSLETTFKLGGNLPIRLERPMPETSGRKVLTIDSMDGIKVRSLFTDGSRSLCRDDNNWGFVCAKDSVVEGAIVLGKSNGIDLGLPKFHFAVPDDNQPVCRWGDIELVSIYGNQRCNDSNTLPEYVNADPNNSQFDLTKKQTLLNYVCTMNRPQGNLPGRININTAAKHVIAAAIPPQLLMSSATDPNALYMAEQIVKNRPYTNLGDLLTKISAMSKYAADPNDDVGEQGIQGDLEERDWILSRLSNIFTVRSDTFTAYILVRLGTDGPQRRMIAIFDRSNVWSKQDKPKLVALHPVPDPR